MYPKKKQYILSFLLFQTHSPTQPKKKKKILFQIPSSKLPTYFPQYHSPLFFKSNN